MQESSTGSETAICVIVAYRAKPGKEEELLDLLRTHVPILQAQNLATNFKPIFLRSKDGVMLEIFEWVSAFAIEQAHANHVVLEMWGRFGAACDFAVLANLPECQHPFAGFQPVTLT